MRIQSQSSLAFIIQIVLNLKLLSLSLAQKYTSIWNNNVTIQDSCIGSNTSTVLNQKIIDCPYQKSYLLSSYQSYYYQPFFNITIQETNDQKIILNNKGLGSVCVKFAEICLENVKQSQQYQPKSDQYYRIFSQLNTYYVSIQIIPANTFSLTINGTQYICWNYQNITLDVDLDNAFYGISGIQTDNAQLKTQNPDFVI
ncbi:hypothetical protein TTHERM_00833670 (macronuclear) [Tetrahymena thermophila SB210]|uniref:Transmembrane protein n=1 Tax=Tetrahymena thermophila (strain SB210) TaxID=312017 RepID=Q23A51_TETTS|nr:hypothetical protein TTHERM_00833670 [Tetrahymena thermophila SB210]EAR93429.2 hypothetical protein TTHERM_00833670 [Tetrahymena thermophila SB210]|eukprot:XP_001013674.2 hypothetical protein TTHERM_00833670 [Tetrahymena thermophila SB210]